MIDSIEILYGKKSETCKYVQVHNHKIEIENNRINESSYSFKITFNQEIISFRNHDYTWVSIENNHISNWYSPKILKLENNQLIQANQQSGIWEVDKSQKNVLLWHINPRYSEPLVNYDSNNSKRIIESTSSDLVNYPLELLFLNDCGIEVSRSKVPFSAIACFTDHCDFDTFENLKQQREFFKKHQIKLTKGFFLNDYSKQKDTACVELHKDEIEKWWHDGHELAYHSLSQSIKPLDESMEDFKSFNKPFNDVITYIDHGFQPYNFSLFDNYKQINANYGSVLREHGVVNFWNYVDTGTSAKDVINQINPKHFTLGKFYKGIKHLSLRVRIPMLIKSIIFHYFNNDYSLRIYRDIAKYSKSLNHKKHYKKHLEMVINVLKLLRLILPIGLFWNVRKRTVFPLAKYSPLIFNHNVTGETFTVFQTLEMIDFKLGLCQNNLDLLIREKGLFIAHTYFSAPMNYHQGKLFGNIGEIDAQVDENFAYLSQKIRSKDIWNPTLSKLINYLKMLEAVTFDCDSDGKIIIHNENELEFREVR